MKQKINKAGNSLAVTNPSKFAKNIGIKSGDDVIVKPILEEGKLIMIFSGIRQLKISSF